MRSLFVAIAVFGLLLLPAVGSAQSVGDPDDPTTSDPIDNCYATNVSGPWAEERTNPLTGETAEVVCRTQSVTCVNDPDDGLPTINSWTQDYCCGGSISFLACGTFWTPVDYDYWFFG